MLFALGAVSSALDALQSLTSSRSGSQSPGSGQNAANPFDNLMAPPPPSGSNPITGGLSQISPQTMSALISAQSRASAGTSATAAQSPSDPLQDLFSQIDADGNGQITKSEFENALGAGGTNLAMADDVFNKLDTNGDGSVSLDEMKSALQGAGGHHHGHHHHLAASSDTGGSDGSATSGTGGTGSSADSLLQALDGASSTTATNSDGSTTTSITYADGTKVTMTTPAAPSASNAATSSYNLIEQMIQREAQTLAASATPALSLSA
jgi:hypothetical protein